MVNNLKEYKELFLPGAIVFAALVIGSSIIYLANMGEGSVPERAGSTAQRETSTNTVDNNGSTVNFTIGVNDHIRGNPNAKVTLVEFSDFECPFCQRFHPTVLRALSEYDGDLRWVYKHFPLDNIHPQARPAAEASECVWEQKGDEGFWEFADAMFESQSRLGNAFYEEVALGIGVNLSQFQTCVSERKYQDKVEQDYQQGIQGGVAGTPGSFVNGVPVRGAIPYSQLQSIIEAQL
ncbi:DsbA family protein [Patescibacteria group bacterium]|nr:DsbA family protein [Patescibacteria group bacterium]